ncbi:hypothetical protein FTO70_14325 [Methanosarcina sp. KYL-1]|uniref:hypothetical protein n=1 Tax=Methanosarcina sp. KYL-1 TaxID=2602068 RepID=UPI00210148D8|nr:hypothetical protein [Methanosarcina sp. KYL-1]MCQ1536826.1 hypothetical protein [Methanosarcina sp. KYL-1]
MNGRAGNDDFVISRNRLLRDIADLDAELKDRLKGKRFRPQEGDMIKIQYIKTRLVAMRLINDVLKEIELSDLEKEVIELRELILKQQQNPGQPWHPGIEAIQ